MIDMPYHAKELMQVNYQLYAENLDEGYLGSGQVNMLYFCVFNSKLRSIYAKH